MPYLPIDMDGRKRAERAAAFLRVHPGVVSWALQELWDYAWREWMAGKPYPDILSELVVLGCLGELGANPRAIEAFVELGFLAPADGPAGRYRVRGAAKWLFGLEGKKRGGKAAKGNLKQYQQEPESAGAEPVEKEAATGLPTGLAGTKPTGRTPALTPNTQHPTPKTKEILKSVSPTPVDRLVELWNQKAPPELPRWRKLTPKRRRVAEARLREEPDWAAWEEAIARLGRSPFCLGANDRGWRAGPEFLLRPDTVARLLEGEFDGTVQTGSQEAGCELIR